MRVANPIAENTSYFASSRKFEIQDSLGVELNAYFPLGDIDGIQTLE